MKAATWIEHVTFALQVRRSTTELTRHSFFLSATIFMNFTRTHLFWCTNIKYKIMGGCQSHESCACATCAPRTFRNVTPTSHETDCTCPNGQHTSCSDYKCSDRLNESSALWDQRNKAQQLAFSQAFSQKKSALKQLHMRIYGGYCASDITMGPETCALWMKKNVGFCQDTEYTTLQDCKNNGKIWHVRSLNDVQKNSTTIISSKRSNLLATTTSDAGLNHCLESKKAPQKVWKIVTQMYTHRPRKRQKLVCATKKACIDHKIVAANKGWTQCTCPGGVVANKNLVCNPATGQPHTSYSCMMCTCPNGTPVDPSACSENGAVQCASCNEGWHLKDGVCATNSCSCSYGSAVSGNQFCGNKYKGQDQCQNCWAGYQLVLRQE